jgi:hypothetical protein
MTTDSRWGVDHRWYGSEDVVDHWAHHLVAGASRGALAEPVLATPQVEPVLATPPDVVLPDPTLAQLMGRS